MMLNLSPEDKNALKPAAQAVAQDFLQTQSDAIEAKIRRRNIKLAQHYPAGDTLPPEEMEILEVYEHERAVIHKLMRECQERLFVDVLRLRRDRAQRRLFEMDTWGRNISSFRRQRWQAKTEAEILNELQRRWHDSLIADDIHA